MIFLAIFVLLASLGIASVAAYFSISGLSLLFVGSGVSIVLMGAMLEIGKLITVTVLHQMWEKMSVFLKVYLVVASMVLSIITSLGIYGYLSNGYNTISVKVNSLTELKSGNNQKIKNLLSDNNKLSNYKPSTKVEDDVSKEQSVFTTQQLSLIKQKEQRITEIRNSIPFNIKKATDDQNNAKLVLEAEINKELSQVPIYNNRLQILDKEIQTWLDQGTGGFFKENGLDKARIVKESQQKERDLIDTQIKSIHNNVDQLRVNYNKSVTDINNNLDTQNKILEKQINDIQKEITTDKQNILDNEKRLQVVVAEQIKKTDNIIKQNNLKINENEKTVAELYKNNDDIDIKINETDVNTFKFVAKSLGIELNKTVNYFILMIISVFDPLAITLLICFNHILKYREKKEPKKEIVITKQIDTPKPTLPTVMYPIATPPVPTPLPSLIILPTVSPSPSPSLSPSLSPSPSPSPSLTTTEVLFDDGVIDDKFPFKHLENGDIVYRNYPQEIN